MRKLQYFIFVLNLLLHYFKYVFFSISFFFFLLDMQWNLKLISICMLNI